MLPGMDAPGEWQGDPNVTRNGDLYFLSFPEDDGLQRALYVSRLVDGRYQPRERIRGALQEEMVTDTYVDPDERFILLAGHSRPDNHGIVDIFISYREPDGSWSGAESLAPRLGLEPNAFLRFPSMSPDGKYLFFIHTLGPRFPTPESQYYWVSADVLPERARR